MKIKLLRRAHITTLEMGQEFLSIDETIEFLTTSKGKGVTHVYLDVENCELIGIEASEQTDADIEARKIRIDRLLQDSFLSKLEMPPISKVLSAWDKQIKGLV